MPQGDHDPVFREPPSEWTVWQLIDSAFPTGGFAHSGGLEAAWKHGEVRNRSEFEGFLESSLNQWAYASFPFVSTAHQEPSRLHELDAQCDAFNTNHVANRASRLQGRAWIAAIDKIFKPDPSGIIPSGDGTLDPRIGSIPETTARNPNGSACGKARPPAWTLKDLRDGSGTSYCGHFSPVFGATVAGLGIEKRAALRMLQFMNLRSLIAAAVRLGISGPMEGQILQNIMGKRAEEILHRCEDLSLKDLAETAPLANLWQANQDRLYSRLFRS